MSETFTNDQLRAAFGKVQASGRPNEEVQLATEHHGKFWSSNGISFTRGNSRAAETDVVKMHFKVASNKGAPGSVLVPGLPMLRALYAQYAALFDAGMTAEHGTPQSVDLDEVDRQWQEVDHALDDQ